MFQTYSRRKIKILEDTQQRHYQRIHMIQIFYYTICDVI